MMRTNPIKKSNAQRVLSPRVDQAVTLVEVAPGTFEVPTAGKRRSINAPPVNSTSAALRVTPGESPPGTSSQPEMQSGGELLKAAPVGRYVTLAKIKPTGTLQARKQINGAVQLFWRYRIGDADGRVSIGIYDAREPPKKTSPGARGFSLEAARTTAAALAQSHFENKKVGGYPAVKAKARAAEEHAAGEQFEAKKHTLQNLLNHYCDHLASMGRAAYRDAASIFKLHVVEAYPKVAALPANQVTGEQVADMMRRVTELGKGRTANKLRSYMRAAYQTARASRSKASIPLHFKPYKVTTNPVSETDPDATHNKTDKHPLTADELRVYWQQIKNLPDLRGAALRLHLLTGGQRIEQLVRLLRRDATAGSIVLFDAKGKPGTPPRAHTVPLVKAAAAALAQCQGEGPFVLSTDGGRTHLSAITLSAWAVEAAGDVVAEFQTKRIRSGVETLLARAGVPSDIRGHLQSHGIAGVQARHYDGHDYFDEKARALAILFAELQRRRGSKVQGTGRGSDGR